jgi:metallo-beta-lactamase family protein
LCSQASAALLPLVLEDALKVGFTKNQGLIDQFLKWVAQQIVPLPYKHWHKTIAGAHGLHVKLQLAGHPGSTVRVTKLRVSPFNSSS